MDGTARVTIAGFTRAEGQYNEAIKKPTSVHSDRKQHQGHRTISGCQPQPGLWSLHSAPQ